MRFKLKAACGDDAAHSQPASVQQPGASWYLTRSDRNASFGMVNVNSRGSLETSRTRKQYSRTIGLDVNPAYWTITLRLISALLMNSASTNPKHHENEVGL